MAYHRAVGINVQRVGHVVLKVRSLERSTGMCWGCRRLRASRIAWCSFGHGDNHHDIALLEVGERAALAPREGVGLYHVALKIGDNLDQLRAAKAHLDAQGVTISGISDHRVSQSIYLNDPDGNGLELFVDADPAVWRRDPSAVASVGPLSL